MTRIEKTIEQLLSHQITKKQAVDTLKQIFDEQRRVGAFEFEIIELSFSSENNHGFIKARIPYGYGKIDGKLAHGQKIDVSPVY